MIFNIHINEFRKRNVCNGIKKTSFNNSSTTLRPNYLKAFSKQHSKSINYHGEYLTGIILKTHPILDKMVSIFL